MMRTFRGKGVSGGIAIGTIRVYQKAEQGIPCRKVADAEAEIARLEAAKEEASREMEALYARARSEVGDDDAAIFESYQMLIRDEDFNNAVRGIVRSREVNAEYAVALAKERFVKMFSAMEDDYMRARAADLCDVAERLIFILRAMGGEQKAAGGAGDGDLPADGARGRLREGQSPDGAGDGGNGGGADLRGTSEREGAGAGLREAASGRDGGPFIVLAEDLTPSETVHLEGERVAAYVTTGGSPYSHTAILARTMAIPAVVGAPVPLDESADGKACIVDGAGGVCYIDPDQETLDRMRGLREAEQRERDGLRGLIGKESVTRDGRRVRICANIGDVRDFSAVLRNDAEGIGLFRSEFLYLGSEDYPTEEEQFRAYRRAAEAMPGRRVVIRTLDIGADKQCGYFKMEKEENPALGCRAIRVCLARPDVFRTQLRALFRASAYGDVAILYPMITSVGEVRRIRAFAAGVREELEAEGASCGSPSQGVMIETPAAAITSDLLAAEADFFSIGTNDLTQYALAADRQNAALGAYYDARHPAVMRMIEMTVESAHRAGIPVGICGDLAADLSLAGEFIAMGVDELSVPPDSILPLRRAVREADLSGEGSARQARP